MICWWHNFSSPLFRRRRENAYLPMESIWMETFRSFAMCFRNTLQNNSRSYSNYVPKRLSFMRKSMNRSTILMTSRNFRWTSWSEFATEFSWLFSSFAMLSELLSSSKASRFWERAKPSWTRRSCGTWTASARNTSLRWWPSDYKVPLSWFSDLLDWLQ